MITISFVWLIIAFLVGTLTGGFFMHRKWKQTIDQFDKQFVLRRR
jgi:hypothetical protein